MKGLMLIVLAFLEKRVIFWQHFSKCFSLHTYHSMKVCECQNFLSRNFCSSVLCLVWQLKLVANNKKKLCFFFNPLEDSRGPDSADHLLFSLLHWYQCTLEEKCRVYNNLQAAMLQNYFCTTRSCFLAADSERTLTLNTNEVFRRH